MIYTREQMRTAKIERGLSYREGAKDGKRIGFTWGLVCGVWISLFVMLIGWNLTR